MTKSVVFESDPTHAAPDRLPSGWRRVALGGIADIVGGGTPSTKDAGNWGGTIPWITPKDLSRSHDRFVRRGERNLSRRGLEASAARMLPAGAVLLTTRAPIGYVALAGNPIATNQGFRSLKVREGAHPEYIFYWLKQNTAELERHATGSTFRELTGSALKEIRLPLPPLSEQRAIVRILGALDDKIEHNRRMNRTLEAMAQALFKDWFVDFGPVRAKMENRAPYLPSEIWKLFLDRFVNSELGEIPERWTVSSLGDMIELSYGKALKAKARNAAGNVPVFGSNGQIGWHDEAFVKRPGIIVGRKGNPGTVTLSSTRFFPIDTTFHVIPKHDHACLYFLFLALQRQDLPSVAADSAVPGLNRNLAYMNKQIKPTANVVVRFEEQVSAMYTRHGQATAESRLLTTIRDTLLPKLISGAIRIRDAETFLEAVA